MGIGVVREIIHRCRTACFANLGLKLVALVIAVIIYVLVHRTPDEAAEEPPPPTCPP